MTRSLWLFALLFASAAASADQRYSSAEAQTGVLELYTSEGCSSCPPADRWVSNLKNRPGLWSTWIPIVFHVDYWDYIGWKDSFADRAYSARQRNYERSGNISTVYTPGFIFNGREWRDWFSGDRKRFPSGAKPGVLTVTVNSGTATIDFAPNVATSRYVGHIALLGFDLVTSVRAGENRGKTLNHDFVVLDSITNTLTKNGSVYSTEMPMPDSATKASRYAVVAWISNIDDQAPIQATGGWLNDNAAR